MPLDTILGHGLSLAAEYQQHRKTRVTRGKGDVENHSNRIGSILVEADEEEWQLDEMTGRDDVLPSPIEDTTSADATDEVAWKAPTGTSPPSGSDGDEQRRTLSLPVIIPQRRPGNRKRGFVRAYAPALGDCGIDQETFMRFLKDFHRSSQASPWFTVVFLSAAIAGFAPSVIAMSVSMAVQAGARAGAEVQRRYRTNDFLDKINETLFKPAGLFAMIITYKSDSPIDSSSRSHGQIWSQVIDVGRDRLTTEIKGSDNFGQHAKKLQISSGTTKGDAELPEFAPLIFPDVDAALQHQDGQTLKSNAKSFQKFLANYMDRRAHMRFAEDNPDSSLKLPESQRQLASNSALSRLGQALQGSHGKEKLLQGLIEGKAGQPSVTLSNEEARDGVANRKRGSGFSGVSGVKRILQQDVLYLTIVNMPSEDEMAVARRALDMETDSMEALSMSA